MKTLYSKGISCYASDTAGVCSALFELGGMTVVHDASGCNSTYSTFDEPRWYNTESISSCTLSLFGGPTLTSIHDYQENHSFD